jgi:hypothetical protein
MGTLKKKKGKWVCTTLLEDFEKIGKNLTKGNLIQVRGCLQKAYALTYALHQIAGNGDLEMFGDDHALTILDEIVVQLQELMKIFRDEEKAA